MNNTTYIDGKDILAEFGVIVTSGGYNSLLSYPSLKQVEYNNWPEEDGIEPDLSNPVLDTKNVEISFATQDYTKVGGIVELVSDMAYHTFEFDFLGVERRLRLLGMPDLTLINNMGSFSLRFSDDFPLEGYVYLAPESNLLNGDYEIDGINLSKYGCVVLKGTRANILESPDTKPGLTINSKYRAGADYDAGSVFFQTKNVDLNILLHANTKEEFWRNYNALLYDISRPGSHVLFSEYLYEEFEFYYNSSKVNKLFVGNKDEVILNFILTITFTSYRAEGVLSLLASESDELIVSENDYAIELNN